MAIFTKILGNINHDYVWQSLLKDFEVDFIFLDQWTAQKCRFVAKGMSGSLYQVALERNSHVDDGDIIFVDKEARIAAIVKIELNPVLVIDMSNLLSENISDMMRTAFELGHAVGNQHWPALVKGPLVYVPLTVDRRVMLSVLKTHNIEGISYEFRDGGEVIPYLAPHEIRRLFGNAPSHNH